MHGSENFWPQFVYTANAPGQLAVMVVPGRTGPVELAKSELDELRRVATPIADQTQRMSYVNLVFTPRG